MKADILIVGSGQAGVPLATRLADAGKEVVLFERGELGGTCVNVGCTPTKTMVASARAAHVVRTAARLGVRVASFDVDFPAVVARKEAIVHRWRSGVERKLHRDRLRIVKAHARFVGPREIAAEGETHRAETVIVNVGARPTVPTLTGLDTVPFLDNRRIMELKELPSHLIVLGGGYIGCEFAQMFRRFGAEVTVVDRNPRLLSREDPDVSQSLEEVFRKEGIALDLGSSTEAVSAPTASSVEVRLAGGRVICGSHLLVAVGRRPNTDDLGCEAAGVKLDARGSVVVDDDYATSAPGVYAVGDVTGGPQFTHAAWDDHRLFFERLMGRKAPGRGARVVPSTVYTDPQVAGVGLSEREARAKGIRFELATMPFGSIARATEMDETAGIMKLLIDPDSEKILGVRLVGAEAGELLHVFVALMKAGASVRAIVDAEFVHPSLAEGIQSLVMRLPRFALS